MAEVDDKFVAEVERTSALNDALLERAKAAEDQDITLPDSTMVPSDRKFLAAVAAKIISEMDLQPVEGGTGGGSLDPSTPVESQVTRVANSIQNWINDLSTQAINVKDVATLRTFEPDYDGQTFYVRYHTYPGYGGGRFYHDPDDTSSADDGGSVIVSADGARYKRDWSGIDFCDITAWGGDPTKNDDIHPVVERMLDANCHSILFPTGRYMVDTQINMRNRSIRGIPGTWGFFNSERDRSGLFAGPNLKHDPDLDDLEADNTEDGLDEDEPMPDKLGFSRTGWMFYSVRECEGLNFVGNGWESTSACGVRSNGYVGRIRNCSFHNFHAAVGQLMCDSRMSDCTFSRCGYGAVSVGPLATTVVIERCEYQAVTYGAWWTGQLTGSSFDDNVWEACWGPFLSASVVHYCRIMGNWIEKEGGSADDPETAFVSRHGQQFQQAFTHGNSFHYGNWKTNQFDQPIDEVADGTMVAGVSADRGKVQVRAFNGYGVEYNQEGIFQMMAAWIKVPLKIKSAPFSKYGGADIEIDSASSIINTPHRHVIVKGPDRWHSGLFEYDMRFQIGGTGDEGNISDRRYTGFQVPRTSDNKVAPGLRGYSDISADRRALLAVPATVYCREGSYGRGMGMFSSVDRGTPGQVRFTTDFRMDNPMVQVTVEDRGFRVDGVEFGGSTGGGSSSRYATQMTVFFTDTTGAARTPTAFWMTLSCHNAV